MPGLDLMVVCKNNKCDVFNQQLMIPLKKRYFLLNEILCEVTCPKCRRPIQDFTELRLFNAKCRIKGRTTAKSKDIVLEKGHRSESTMLALEYNEGSILNWIYAWIEVIGLTEH